MEAFDLVRFAEQQLKEATDEFIEKSRLGILADERKMKIEPRIFFVKLPEGFATNVANYPELNPTVKRFFNSVDGKSQLGRWLSMMIGTGLVDAVVMVIEAFAVVLDKEEAEARAGEVVRVSDDPRKRELVLVEIITKDYARAIAQEIKDGQAEGEPVRLGFKSGEVASSRFAPHLDQPPVGATIQ